MNENPLTPATRPKSPIDVLRDTLNRTGVQSKIKEVLGERAPQFASSVVQLVSASRQLQNCDPNTVLAAAMTAAILDLPIDKNLGFAHIVPYGNAASFQCGYKGFVQLAIRSGQYKHLNATEVYEGEFINYNRLTGELKLDFTKKSSEKVVGYAAYFQLTSGYEQAVYWSVEDVTAHARKFSQAYKAQKKDSPWFTNPDAMGCKTAIKDLLSHWGIMSIQMQRALTEDQGVRRGVDAATVEYPDNDAATSRPVHSLTEGADFMDVVVEKTDGDLGPQKPAASAPTQNPTASAPTPAAEPKKRGRPAKVETQPVAAPAPVATPATQTPPEPPAAAAAPPDDEPPFEEPAGAEAEAARMAEEEEVHNLVTQIGKLAADSKVTESQVVAFAKANRMMAGLSTNLSDMTVAKLKLMVSNWQFACQNIAKFPAT